MPGNLTKYLEEGFRRNCPKGWSCDRECRLISAGAEKTLGYSPRADVVLINESTRRRVWVEFEISRADPVANHAKFVTAHHLGQIAPEDSFLSMVSSHVTRGRRNLASGLISVMRHMGITAFQTVLLPHFREADIFKLNHASDTWLQSNGPDVGLELERAIRVCSPMFERGSHSIYFASDPFEVLQAVRRWNLEIKEPQGILNWGGRRAQYFVYDPFSGDFAPSKFCAFLPLVSASQVPAEVIPRSGMTLEVYAGLGEHESRFDGAIAWKHLVSRLGFIKKEISGDTSLFASFRQWIKRIPQPVAIERKSIYAIFPPSWYIRGTSKELSIG